MSAAIIPFPRSLDRPYVSRHARAILGKDPAEGEIYLEQQMAQQRSVMGRRGVDAGLADRRIADLRSAIRAEMWRVVLMPERAR